MTRPLSNDLRERVVAAVIGGAIRGAEEASQAQRWAGRDPAAYFRQEERGRAEDDPTLEWSAEKAG